MTHSIDNRVHQGGVVEIKTVAENAYSLRIAIAGGFNFVPGQYVWIRLPVLKYADERGDRRAFSIASIPNDTGEIEIVFRARVSGFMKTLAELKSGDELEVIGPFGSAFRLTVVEEGQELVMIAGGTGVTPFISLVRYLVAAKKSLKVSLIYFNASPATALFTEELKELQDQDQNLKVYFYNHGEIFSQEHLPKEINVRRVKFFISGPPAMVDGVNDALHAQGVVSDQLRFEGVYPTGKFSKILSDLLNGVDDSDIKLEFGGIDIFRAAVNSSSNHIVITDVNGIIFYANTAAQKITGYTLAEMAGQTPRLWGGMMEPEFYDKLWRDKMAGISFGGEMKNRRKSGEIYYALSHIAPIKTNRGETIGFISTEEDISQEKEKERRLEELNSRLELATSAAQIGIFDWDVQNSRLVWDDMMFRIYGIKPAEFGGSYEFWERTIYPEDLPQFSKDIAAAIKNGVELDISFRIFVSGSTNIRFIKMNAAVVRDEKGEPLKMIGVNRDFTKEQEVDKAKTEFVSLASHQMRTPLTAVGWNLEMLVDQKTGKLNIKQKKYIEAIEEQNKQMKELIDALLNVSRLELGVFAIEPVPTDVVGQCRSVVKEMEPLRIAKDQVLNLKIARNVPIISADPNLVRIIFQNLISNALKYTPAQGKVNVSIDLKKSFEIVAGKQLEKDSLLIGVVDNGLGIPADVHPQVFLRMFRADNVRQIEGTGLGLYIVKLILEAVGGEIWFESVEGKGTAFYVALPLEGMKKKDGIKKISATV